MNQKILFILSLLSIMVFLNSCGGGGGGGLSTPPGTNTGVPSVVKLLDVQNIAQTKSTVYLKAKVLDGNGTPVQNVPVTFTNLSAPFGQLSATIANTDATGVAIVTLQSADPGFSTVLAEINSGAGQVRDRLTLYFTDFNFEVPGQALLPFMTLDVDSVPGDAIYDQPSDFILYESSTDDTVEVRATVFETVGVRVGAGTSVTWTADRPEAVFVSKEAITDGNGQAKAIVQIPASSIRDIGTHVNIGASAGNGAFNMLTLFLNPVTVNSVVVTAVPTTVDSGATSQISATVTTNLGTPVPDGTMVNFTSTGGSTLGTPFAQTTDGVAKTSVTVPIVTSDTSVSVTASVGGKSGSVSVKVIAEEPTPTPLTVVPATVSINGTTGGTATFIISGGTAPYTTTSSDLTKACNSTDADCSDPTDKGTWTGSSVKVTVPAGTAAGSVTINVFDSDGATKTATINIVEGGGGPPAVVFTIPANGATNVPVDADLIARFNKDLDPVTIENGTFTLFNTTDGVSVVNSCIWLGSGTDVSYDSSTFTASMCISPDLLHSKTYTATLSTGIRDLAGTPMAAPYTFSFTTAP